MAVGRINDAVGLRRFSDIYKKNLSYLLFSSERKKEFVITKSSNQGGGASNHCSL